MLEPVNHLRKPWKLVTLPVNHLELKFFWSPTVVWRCFNRFQEQAERSRFLFPLILWRRFVSQSALSLCGGGPPGSSVYACACGRRATDAAQLGSLFNLVHCSGLGIHLKPEL